ncbi:hypothetical protein QJS10_CPB15g01264 [Acorus calamus]|uniref:Uncharacterized protein n=1 Tax=Acorus calamus TaxID=4465 RepID=A0AAV9D6N1_ACOCL|nr:hypothetical protein QJS10_CPB15g01264 [Acorus calamus]
MHHGRHRSPAERPMGFGPSHGGGPYNAEYNRSFHCRDPPRPYLQPPPPPPPSAAPVPVEKLESAKAEMEEEKGVKGDELMGESGGIAEKEEEEEEEEEEVKDVVGSVSEEGGVSLLKLCGIAKRKKDKIEAMAAEKVLSQKGLEIQMMLAADIYLGMKICDFWMECYVFKRRTDDKALMLDEAIEYFKSLQLQVQMVQQIQMGASTSANVMASEGLDGTTNNVQSGSAGEYVKPTDVESLEQCAIQNYGKESPSDEHCHAIGVMQLSFTDEVMVDAEKPVDANESPRVETKDHSRMEEDKQQHLCASFKICDLNLMDGPEITEVPDNDPVVEGEKKALLDVGLSIGGNSSGNNSGNSGDKVIEDGYGLTIPEFLGNDTNCSSIQTDINNLQSGMILHGGQVISNVDDSIYTSLGELPLNYMDMEVWDHPSLGYENNPSLEYEKFF